MTMDRAQRLNEATVLLLARVSGVEASLLRSVELRPRERNWLRAPWFGESPGGAMVLGDRIYLSRTLFIAPTAGHPVTQLQWLLLLAHEVVHVQQAQRFGSGASGRMRFVFWAAGQYTRSFLLNGTKAYHHARFEQEAEMGRIALRALLQRTGGTTPDHPVVQLAMTDDVPGMKRWLTTALPDQGRTTSRPVQGASPST